MYVPGRWLRKTTTWRKISLATWSTPDCPTIYGTLELDVERLQDFLQRRTAESGVRCTMTHAITRALALMLRRHPDCNVIVRRRRIWQRDDVDIFHQVAMPLGDGRGGADLSGAVVRRADTKRVEAIAAELAEGARKVREKKDGEMARTRGLLNTLPGWLLRPFMAILDLLAYDLNLSVPGMPPDPFGSAMVTSVGMLGIKSGFAPLVTFSHCPLILLLGQVEDRVVVRDGQIVVRPMVTLTSTIDHRVVDGYQAGVLASELRRMLEEPELLDSGLPD